MKNKKLTSHIIALFVICSLLITYVSASLAWLAEDTSKPLNVSGSSISSYFASGKGTAEDPYELNHPRHVYNLSWLQNSGYFEEKTYFELTADIDMKGYLNGTDTTSGAVPPIGTESNPFIGEFNGYGNVISNLWVSSNPDDWKEKPANKEIEDIGTQIGFFGNAGQSVIDENTAEVANIYDIVLENIEVTSHIPNSTVGIVAGYMNCDMTNVGVKNAKLQIENVAVKSEVSLIGEIGMAVEWVNRPGYSDGMLLIDPTNGFTSINSTEVAVPDSTQNSAYYIPSLTASTVSGGLKGSKLLCEDNLEWNATTGQTLTLDKSNNVDATADNVNESLWARIDSNSVPTYIQPSNAPTYNSLQTISDLGISVPKNSIWFKPHGAGTCEIAITKTNNSSDEYLSIYSYKRNSSGNIDTTTWKENVFKLTKGVVGNKGVAVFKFVISQTAIDDGYEFVIGKSTTSGGGTAGFLYLILAGAGNDSSASGMIPVKMIGVDYVYKKEDGTYITMGEDYEPNNVLLTFDTTYNGTLYYNMSDEPNNNGLVYYNPSSVITDKISSGSVGSAVEYSTGVFPPREEE